MENDINILILSCGTRNKIVQYFKKELTGRGLVIAADSSYLAPALYEADKHFIVPRITDDGYLNTILTICKENNVKAILSLIDPELSILAEHKQAFQEIGTMPIVSDFDIVEMCFDKYKMFQFLVRNGIPTVNSYIDKTQFYRDVEAGIIDYPVFVKPVKGSASLNINIVHSKEEIEVLFRRFDHLMIQEFMNGIEYGVDVYVDMISGIPVAIFTKEKIKMRAGETDKSVSVKDRHLFKFIKNFLKKANLKGVMDIDVFKVNGKFYISEVNPRFGGGYPHSYESGVNIPKMIVNNLIGNVNKDVTGRYDEDIYMMKYSEVEIIRK